MGGVKIEPANSVQLLGLTISTTIYLTLRGHTEVTVKKCNAVLGVLSIVAKYLLLELLKLAYRALVRSHAECCSAVTTTRRPRHTMKNLTPFKLGDTSLGEKF